MKIICKDNFDRETVDDILICENINRSHGEIAIDAFNIAFGWDNSPYFYKLVGDDYELYVFKP